MGGSEFGFERGLLLAKRLKLSAAFGVIGGRFGEELILGLEQGDATTGFGKFGLGIGELRDRVRRHCWNGGFCCGGQLLAQLRLGLSGSGEPAFEIRFFRIQLFDTRDNRCQPCIRFVGAGLFRGDGGFVRFRCRSRRAQFVDPRLGLAQSPLRIAKFVGETLVFGAQRRDFLLLFLRIRLWGALGNPMFNFKIAR